MHCEVAGLLTIVVFSATLRIFAVLSVEMFG